MSLSNNGDSTRLLIKSLKHLHRMLQTNASPQQEEESKEEKKKFVCIRFVVCLEEWKKNLTNLAHPPQNAETELLFILEPEYEADQNLFLVKPGRHFIQKSPPLPLLHILFGIRFLQNEHYKNSIKRNNKSLIRSVSNTQIPRIPIKFSTVELYS